MKRTKISALLSLVVALILVLSTAIPVSAATVKISKAKATMEKDSTLTLKVSGTSSNVKWSSSNKAIAKVSSKGKVTALKEGSATIKATVDKQTYTCAVTVVDSNKTTGTEVTLKLPDFPAVVYRGRGDYMYCEDTISDITYSNDKNYLYLKVKQSRTADDDWGSAGGYIVIYNDEYEELAKVKIEEGNVGKKITKEYKIALTSNLKAGGSYILDLEDDGYVRPSKDKDGNKKQDITILLPSLPQTISYYRGDNIQSSAKVTNISYESSDTSATLLFTLEKTYDSRGTGQSDSCMIGWKLYDFEGYIIDSGTFYSDAMKVGDKQKNGKEYIYGLEKGETYSLEILNVN